MRIALRITDGTLRRALADLLAGAGHTLASSGRTEARPDLLVLSEPGMGATLAGVPTLYLRPSTGAKPDADPEGALVRAFLSGGAAVWAPPLDPARLLAALTRDAELARSVPVRHPPAAWLDASPDPWLLVDPLTGSRSWENEAARVAGATADGPALAGVTGEEDAGPLLQSVCAESRGRRLLGREGDADRRLAVWWTEPGGHRVLGVLAWAAGEAAGAAVNQRTLADIGRATATLAHEIRNPIAALAGALDVLAEATSPDDRAEVAAQARERLVGMRALLDDVLRFARPFAVPPGPVDVQAVVASAVATISADPRFRAVAVEAEVPDDLPSATAHEEPLRQAILNLLLNAAEAQGGKGVVRVSATLERGRVVVRVRDEGPGIRPEVRDRVFEPFRTTKPGGTGLGLAHVRKVVEAAGGRVRLEDVSVGACFALELRT